MAIDDVLTTSETARAIRGSPGELRRLAQARPRDLGTAADRLAGRRVWLVGLGTSFHAAVVGEHLFRSIGAEVRAVRSFEFSQYPPEVGPRDAVVALSHSGETRFTRDAVALARRSGAFTVAITAQGGDAGAEATLPTAPKEKSHAHTVSYLASLFELGRLALALNERGRGERPSWEDDWAHTAELVEGVLGREEELDVAAAAASQAGAIYAVGGGPNKATAWEASLKLKEMAFARVEGLELETSLHGPLCALGRGDLALVFAAPGPAFDRSRDLLRALKHIEARVFSIGAEGDFPLEGVDEAWTPVPMAAAAQLVALKLAALRGVDPDVMRTNDPAYAKAFDACRF